MSDKTEMSLIQIERHDKWLNKLFRKLGLIEDKTPVIEDKFEDEESSDQYLIGLDPKEWKHQDHYRVFGIKQRYYASADDIKKQYRRKVLKHHPDKRGSTAGQPIDLDLDYYSCITRGYEILSDPLKRRSYDSIDDTFDDEIPSMSAYNKTNFYQIFGPVFKLNARWSNTHPVPELGGENSDKDYVNNFYNFWYDFDSWREYSYLDEEDKERGENREERKWMEKQNRAARAQRKKEENQRLKKLVDNAYQCDPRISKFKDEEKQKKLSQKLAKQQSIKQKQLEEERLKRQSEEREKTQKLEKENELKAKKLEEKRQKEVLKKQLKKERKDLQNLLQMYNYFADNESKRIQNLSEFDKMANIFNIQELIQFRQEFEKLDDKGLKENYFYKQIECLNSKLENERNGLLASNNTCNGQTNSSSKKNWSYEDIQLLIKAVKLFPAGTKDRWSVIAEWVNTKSASGVTRNHRDCIAQAKDMDQLDKLQALKAETNNNAFKRLEESQSGSVKPTEESTPSQRFDAPIALIDFNVNPWTKIEQLLLEQGMKTYPSTLGPERWDRIADCIPNRSRADCIQRYKQLVAQTKAKNEAKTSVSGLKTKK